MQCPRAAEILLEPLRLAVIRALVLDTEAPFGVGEVDARDESTVVVHGVLGDRPRETGADEHQAQTTLHRRLGERFGGFEDRRNIRGSRPADPAPRELLNFSDADRSRDMPGDLSPVHIPRLDPVQRWNMYQRSSGVDGPPVGRSVDTADGRLGRAGTQYR
jgi:hypothetical protein